jgi:hypothetical protein
VVEDSEPKRMKSFLLLFPEGKKKTLAGPQTPTFQNDGHGVTV